MVSTPGTDVQVPSAERAYHAGGGGKVVTSKVPGTPSRKDERDRQRRDKAVQDPGLRDYRLGSCIGKGAFGSVYKAFNYGTGETVAVKQIKLVDVPKSELRMIEAEIDLLKNLHHDNIVKYIGFVKTADCLNIILEYCENGSLHSICKAYGKFPENLVGVYMTQVLHGLQYLHDQGVIHRDIKGANILTTKDGTVKLADFGVSTSTLAGPDKEAQVVGTPYWMAPEIIQLSGATSASDIWSVGCTVIELLQGKPPYHNLAAMPALFAIVNDDHPPLPEGVSPMNRDFLMQCFQKDPNLRVSARKLLKHAWIVGCRRSDAPVSKAPANFSQAVEEVKQWNKALKSSESAPRVSTGSDSTGIPLPGHGATRSTTATESRANAAGIAAPTKGPLTLAKPRPTADAFRSPELADDDNWDNDFATAISPSHLHLPHIKGQDNFGGLLSSERLKAFASIDGARDEPEAAWEESYEGGELLTIKPPAADTIIELAEFDAQEQTIRPTPKKTARSSEPRELKAQQGHKRKPSRQALGASAASAHAKSPTKSQFPAKFELPARPDMLYREQTVEDYSDLLADDDHVFQNRLSLVAKDSPQLFHPSDLTSLPRSVQPSATGGSLRRQAPVRPSVLPERRTRSTIEIQRFAEDEDEDFSDVFGETLTERDESDRGSEDGGGGGGLMLLSKLSNNSWLGDDDDEDEDPFAMMEPGWDEMDLEANIARDRHARLAERVEDMVRALTAEEGDETLAEVSEDLLALLWESREVKDLIIGAHGLLPILEILETCTVKNRQHMILQLLKIVNAIILDDVELQENLCFVGGIPIITKFAARQYSNDVRLEAAAFVRQMYQTSTLTLQMFVSAGGLNVLVEFLDEDYGTSRDLVLIGVNGIWNVFELQGPTPKNDFCRIFSRSKILDPLALVLHKVLVEDDKDELSELIEGRIVYIFYLFSQAENHVKKVVADRQVLKIVLKDLGRMTPIHQITMLKFIKNLSMLSSTLESLHSADAIDFLIDVLGQSMKKGARHFREMSNQVLNTMFNLCRLSKERQEYAAGIGIVPLLLKVLKTDRPPKEFVLPILCDMAHSGSKGRRSLWQNNGLEFYVSLLADQYWQVTALDAIFVWLQEETAKVESRLLDGTFTAAIVSCFASLKANAFDPNLPEPLLKVLRLSPAVAASLAKAAMYAGIAQKLTHKKAVVRLNLLRLVRSIMDGCEADGTTSMMNSGSSTSSSGRQLQVLFDTIQLLADQDSAVLVRNLASELVRSHIMASSGSNNNTSPPRRDHHSATSSSGGPSANGIGGSISASGGPPRSRSGPRRTASYTSYHSNSSSSSSAANTPPSLLASVSMPLTPTDKSTATVVPAATPRGVQSRGGGQHQPRPYHRASLSQSSAYIEVAATPRRSAVTVTQERDAALLYRPRSRDGGGGGGGASAAGMGAAITAIPRRVSGDAASAVKSKLPRTPAAAGPARLQSGGGTAAATAGGRSESSTPNKENVVVAAGRGRGSSSSNSNSSRYGSGGSGSSGSAMVGSGSGSIGAVSTAPTTTTMAAAGAATATVQPTAGMLPVGSGTGSTRSTRQPSFSASTASSRRRPRAPSSDLRWS